MHIEEQLLTASIRNTITDAERSLVKYSNLRERGRPENADLGEHENDLEDALLYLSYLIEKVFRDTAILAERLGLPAYRSDIVKKRDSFKNIAHTVPGRWDDMLHSPPLAAARTFYNSLAVMTESREVTGLGVFERILESTPKIINQKGVSPRTEGDVRKAVRDILEYSFPDVVSEMPIPKNTKVFRPDIGVRSLMAAAEYKFINTKAKAKNALDGIYADMHGYAGSHEWRSFYAVLYMTSQFFTQREVETEFVLVKADLSWRPIVVVGPGTLNAKAARKR